MNKAREKQLETLIKINLDQSQTRLLLDQRFLKEDELILTKSKEECQNGWCVYLYCLGFVAIIVSLLYYSDNR